jgi:hypothetical protein
LDLVLGFFLSSHSGGFKIVFCSCIIVHTQGLGFQFYVLTLVAYQFFNSNLLFGLEDILRGYN